MVRNMTLFFWGGLLVVSLNFFELCLKWVLLPSRELTYPPDKAYLKIILLFPRWDMLDSWRVYF